MDEKSNIENDLPYFVENINKEDFLFRHVPVIQTEKNTGRRFPKESHFMPDSDGLSTYLEKLISIQDTFLILGLTYKKGTTDFKKIDTYLLFKISVAYIRSIESQIDVLHTPVYNGNPAPVGLPNNLAHSSVKYDVDDLEVRVKLSDYCRTIENESLCRVDFNSLNAELENLKAKLNDTRFHKLNFN